MADHSVLSALRRLVNTALEQGVTAAPDRMKKRIRIANGMAIFGGLLLLASIPFDLREAPPWATVEDALGGLAYLMFPLLNRRGYLTASRVFAVTIANLLVLGDAFLLGRESGTSLLFIALCAVPFSLFDLSERVPLAFTVLLAVGCFFVASSDLAVRNHPLGPNYSASTYFLYSGGVTLAVLLFTLLQSTVANARAERALREDIARRERAERELERTRASSIYAAKMAALGEMSGNIAHEVNNPLAAILLRAERLRQLARDEHLDHVAVAQAGRAIETTVHRIRGIVDALRAFARDVAKDPMRPESVRQIVNDTLELTARRFEQQAIRLDVPAIPDDLLVSCRAVQVSQVLLNLLNNACDAVEGRPERVVRIRIQADDQRVRIAVVDSGPGIAPALRDRIMDPFFTTKSAGRGTGLGLSVSKGIAEAHGGELAYDPSSAETRFVLTLVRAHAAAA